MYYVNKFFFNKSLVSHLHQPIFSCKVTRIFFFVDFLKITSFIFISCINQGQILFLSQSPDDDGYICDLYDTEIFNSSVQRKFLFLKEVSKVAIIYTRDVSLERYYQQCFIQET